MPGNFRNINIFENRAEGSPKVEVEVEVAVDVDVGAKALHSCEPKDHLAIVSFTARSWPIPGKHSARTLELWELPVEPAADWLERLPISGA